MVTVGGAALVLVASFLPWLELDFGLVTESWNAWEETDAGLSVVATLVAVGAGVFAAGWMVVSAQPDSATRGAHLAVGIVAIAAGTLAGILAITRFGLISDDIETSTFVDATDVLSPGPGLILASLGGLGIIAGGIVDVVTSRRTGSTRSAAAAAAPAGWATPTGWNPPSTPTAPSVPASTPPDTTAAAPPPAQPAQPAPAPTEQVAVPSGGFPAAWHPDPMRRYEFRYWDGTRWTEHVSTGGQVGSDPI